MYKVLPISKARGGLEPTQPGSADRLCYRAGHGSGYCHSLGRLHTFAQVGTFLPSKASAFRHKAFSAPTSPAARPGGLEALAIRAGASSWDDGWGHVIARRRVDFVCV